MSDREKLIELIVNVPKIPIVIGGRNTGKTYQTAEHLADHLIANGVMVQRHGCWYGEGDGYADGELVYDVWYCSECNNCIDDGTDNPDLLPKFCSECGAKMDGARYS